VTDDSQAGEALATWKKRIVATINKTKQNDSAAFGRAYGAFLLAEGTALLNHFGAPQKRLSYVHRKIRREALRGVILDLMLEHPHWTLRTLSIAAGASVATVHRALTELRAKNLLPPAKPWRKTPQHDPWSTANLDDLAP
jgi:hypothetical protein